MSEIDERSRETEAHMDADTEFDDEWTRRMKQLGELSESKMPSAQLEERTVRELRRRGLLRRRPTLSPAWLAGTVAASLALFATGVVVGQYLGARSTASVVAEIQHKSDAAAAAAQVQQTGTAYVRALETLVAMARQNPNGAAASQAREVALTALHEAANEVVRLAPNDPVTAKILQGIEQDQKQNQAPSGRPAERQIVWF